MAQQKKGSLERPCHLVIQGAIGGRKRQERFLFETASVSIDFQMNIVLLPIGPIQSPTPQDPRLPLLESHISQIPGAPSADTWITNQSIPNTSLRAKRRIWLPPSHTIIPQIPHERMEGMEIRIDQATPPLPPLSNVYPLPLGINPFRFHPGVQPLPGFRQLNRFILLYRGSVQDKFLEQLDQFMTTFSDDAPYILLISDYGYESVRDDHSSRSWNPRTIHVHNIHNERQLAGFYSTGDILLTSDAQTIEPYEALACGTPVLTQSPVLISHEKWKLPYDLSLETSETFKQTLDQIASNHTICIQEGAKACRRVHQELNWHRVISDFLKTRIG